jgi:hypothetical protein
MKRKDNGSGRLVAATLISMVLAAPVIGHAVAGQITGTAAADQTPASVVPQVRGELQDTPWDP